MGFEGVISEVHQGTPKMPPKMPFVHQKTKFSCTLTQKWYYMHELWRKCRICHYFFATHPIWCTNAPQKLTLRTENFTFQGDTIGA